MTAPKTGRAVALIAVGGAASLYALGFLLTAMYAGIGHVLRPWLSALIVGGVLVITGGVVAWIAVLYLKSVRLPGLRARPPQPR